MSCLNLEKESLLAYFNRVVMLYASKENTAEETHLCLLSRIVFISVPFDPVRFSRLKDISSSIDAGYGRNTATAYLSCLRVEF